MVSLNVFDPSGATEITRLHADRLDSLTNKNIAMLSDDMKAGASDFADDSRVFRG